MGNKYAHTENGSNLAARIETTLLLTKRHFDFAVLIPKAPISEPVLVKK